MWRQYRCIDVEDTEADGRRVRENIRESIRECSNNHHSIEGGRK
jgi:hypothetical protein